MAFSVHTLDIAIIISLLRRRLGVASRTRPDHTAQQQPATRSNHRPAPTTKRRSRRRAQRRTDYRTGDPTTHPSRIAVYPTRLKKSKLAAHRIIITELLER
jgi:hypothetical protein